MKFTYIPQENEMVDNKSKNNDPKKNKPLDTKKPNLAQRNNKPAAFKGINNKRGS